MENTHDKNLSVPKNVDSTNDSTESSVENRAQNVSDSTDIVDDINVEEPESNVETKDGVNTRSEDSVSDSNIDSVNTSSVTDAKSEKKKSAKTRINSKKGSKKKREPVGKVGFTIICVALGITSAAAGSMGGYLLYQQVKPETSYATSYSDFKTLRERAAKNPDLLKEFEGEEYNIVNVALDKYSLHKHTLTMGYGLVKSVNGDQTVRAVTLGGENKAFNQNISSTGEDAIATVNTAFRFYYDITDPKNLSINAYEKNTSDQWTADMQTDNVYSPDTFIEKYGKLNYGEYIVDDSDKFVELGDEGDGKIINGVSIYQINKNSVASCPAPTKNDKGNYVFKMKLLANSACKYYANQIKTNGGLQKFPRFEQYLNLSFELNEDFELVSSFVEEQYEITLGIATSCNSTMRQQYFYSDEETHVVMGKTINVPEKGEQFPLDIQEDGTIFIPESN